MTLFTPVPFSLFSSSLAPSTLPAWSASTSYVIGNRVVCSDYREYECKVAHSGKTPKDNRAYWTLLGTSNRYKMFDQFLYSQSVSADGSLSVVLHAPRVDAVFVNNTSAQSVTIVIASLVSGEILEESLMELYGGIYGWDDYFFYEFGELKKSFFYVRTTLSLDVSISIILSHSSSVAACGQVFLGKKEKIGNTQWRPSASILDYSIIDEDPDTGETYLSRGKTTKEIEYTVSCPTTASAVVLDKLASICGAPAIFFHGEGFDILTVYGYPAKVEVVLENSVESILSLTVKGLI